MRIFYINNLGNGFADHLDIEPGTTVATLFHQRMKSASPDDFLIRVNRQPVPGDQVLQEGDRLSITPLKIEGARR
jgi:sulfur carrier protein ThiS